MLLRGRRILRRLVLAAGVCAGAPFAVADDGGVFGFVEGFEVGNFLLDTVRWSLSHADEDFCPPNIFSGSIKFAGSKSWQVECRWNAGGTNAYRNEIMLNKPRNLAYGTDYWIGFAAYFPSKYWAKPTTPRGNYTTIFLQVHGGPDKNAAGERIEPYRNPPLALAVRDRERSITLAIKGDSQAISTRGHYDRSSVLPALPSLPMDQWVEFVLHYRPHFDPSKSPTTQLWINGELVVDDHRINAFNDQRPPFLKHGLYVVGWRRDWAAEGRVPPQRVVRYYSDAFKVSVGGSYEDVAPSGGGFRKIPLSPVLSVD